MGIGFVLMLWAVVLTIVASIVAAVLGAATMLLTRGAQWRRKRLIVVSVVFPFLCLGWAGTVFVVQAIINETMFHRDPGLGDTWTCPLPNGYAILMIDVTDYGTVYNPKTQPGSAVGQSDDAVFNVKSMQVSGTYILGASIAARDFPDPADPVDGYFLLDTAQGRHVTFSKYDELLATARQHGVQVKLEPIQDVYSKYRFTWFDIFAFCLLLTVPLLGFAGLVWWALRVRGSRAQLAA